MLEEILEHPSMVKFLGGVDLYKLQIAATSENGKKPRTLDIKPAEVSKLQEFPSNVLFKITAIGGAWDVQQANASAAWNALPT